MIRKELIMDKLDREALKSDYKGMDDLDREA